jgi:hypothetical protein
MAAKRAHPSPLAAPQLLLTHLVHHSEHQLTFRLETCLTRLPAHQWARLPGKLLTRRKVSTPLLPMSKMWPRLQVFLDLCPVFLVALRAVLPRPPCLAPAALAPIPPNNLSASADPVTVYLDVQATHPVHRLRRSLVFLSTLGPSVSNCIPARPDHHLEVHRIRSTLHLR